MASINSAGDGDWHTPATWVGGVVPGTGDDANILAGHTVTIAAPVTAIQKIAVLGNLVMNADITMDNSNGCYIYINAGGTFTNNGTPGAPRYISQAPGGTATAQWYFAIWNNSGVARRLVNLNNVIMSRNWWFLGKSTYANEFVSFNVLYYDPGRIMLRPSPIVRDFSMHEHIIDGRSMSRIYPRGKSAGRCTLRGYIPYGAEQYIDIMENLKSTTQRVSLTTDVVHMGQARVESLRWGEMKGNNLPFTMVLVEDR
jgi:hypothetical protein